MAFCNNRDFAKKNRNHDILEEILSIRKLLGKILFGIFENYQVCMVIAKSHSNLLVKLLCKLKNHLLCKYFFTHYHVAG